MGATSCKDIKGDMFAGAILTLKTTAEFAAIPTTVSGHSSMVMTPLGFSLRRGFDGSTQPLEASATRTEEVAQSGLQSDSPANTSGTDGMMAGPTEQPNSSVLASVAND